MIPSTTVGEMAPGLVLLRPSALPHPAQQEYGAPSGVGCATGDSDGAIGSDAGGADELSYCVLCAGTLSCVELSIESPSSTGLRTTATVQREGEL
eukprot:gene3014-biopygen3173